MLWQNLNMLRNDNYKQMGAASMIGRTAVMVGITTKQLVCSEGAMHDWGYVQQ